jgi:hypothetical protein
VKARSAFRAANDRPWREEPALMIGMWCPLYGFGVPITRLS